MRWDDRRLEDRIAAEARFRQIDLSKFITTREAAAIMRCTRQTILRHFNWLEGVKICGRSFVKRNRTEWLRKFRDGTLTSDDQMGESLAPFDVRAAREELERKKREEEEKKRLEAESRRLKGFHIDGKYWWDYDNNDTWVPIKQAKINLAITGTAIHGLANRGVIRRRWANKSTRQPVDDLDTTRTHRGYAAMFSLRDIEAYIDRREQRGRSRPVSFDDPDRPFTPIRVYDMEDAERANSPIITIRQAAEILGVKPRRISDLVAKGKLKAYQRIHNRQGVRVWLSDKEVRQYAQSERRLKFRQAYDERQKRLEAGDDRKMYPKPYQFEFGEEYVFNGIRNLKRSFGEYYTVRQAAQILGCTPSAVKQKIKNKILPGARVAKTSNPHARWNDRRWWFIKKEDLHAYKASSEYRKRRKVYVEARHRKLFGEELDPLKAEKARKARLKEWPATPGEDQYIPHDPRNVVFLRGEQARSRLGEYLRWKKLEETRSPEEPVTPGEDRYIPHDPRNVVFLKTEHQRWREYSLEIIEEATDALNDPRTDGGSYPPQYFFPGHQLADRQIPKDDES